MLEREDQAAVWLQSIGRVFQSSPHSRRPDLRTIESSWMSIPEIILIHMDLRRRLEAKLTDIQGASVNARRFVLQAAKG